MSHPIEHKELHDGSLIIIRHDDEPLRNVRRAIESGRLMVVCAEVMGPPCSHCGERRQDDSLCGIVVETDRDVVEQVLNTMGIEAGKVS